MQIMKIYLTEFEINGLRVQGPNIVASSWDIAAQAAEENNLILTGQLDNILVDSTGNYTYQDLTTDRVIH